jgi:hypothetical protein
LLQALISGTFCIILPSMHQLITNPTTDDQQANATVDRVCESWSPSLTQQCMQCGMRTHLFGLHDIKLNA